MPYERDPVSILWDLPAAYLLERARKARGGWQGTRIADPSPRQRAALARLGINPDRPDNPSAIGGRARAGRGVDAKTRWARGFVRALMYQNDRRHGGPGLAVEVQVGRHKPAGVRVPAGRAVRIRIRRGGSVARRIVRQLPDSKRIYTDEGFPGQRWSDPGLRDWG